MFHYLSLGYLLMALDDISFRYVFSFPYSNFDCEVTVFSGIYVGNVQPIQCILWRWKYNSNLTWQLTSSLSLPFFLTGILHIFPLKHFLPIIFFLYLLYVLVLMFHAFLCIYGTFTSYLPNFKINFSNPYWIKFLYCNSKISIQIIFKQTVLACKSFFSKTHCLSKGTLQNQFFVMK